MSTTNKNALNKLNNSDYRALIASSGVKLLIDNYVKGYGYEVLEPETAEGGIYSVADREQSLILTLMEDGTILKTDGFRVPKGNLTNGEVKLARMDRANQISLELKEKADGRLILD